VPCIFSLSLTRLRTCFHKIFADYDGFESDEAIGGSSSDEDEEDSEEESDEIDDAEEERDGREEGKCENTEGPKQEGMALSDLGALGSGTEVPGSDR